MEFQGFLSSCNRVVGPLIDLRLETWVSSRFATGESGLLSRCRWELCVPLDLRPPLEWQVGTHSSSPVAVGNTGFLSICSRKLKAPLDLVPETQDSTLVVIGISGFLSSCSGTQCSSRLLGAPLELSWGDSSLAVMWRVAPILLQCREATHFFCVGFLYLCGQIQLCSCGGFNSL